jgi:hypothetical protein
MKSNQTEDSSQEIPNGPAAAAILAAGLGCLSVSLLGWLGDFLPSLAHFFIFYPPTGPLSGVTTTAILFWLLVWAVLSRLWRGKTVSLGKISIIALLLVLAGLLLSFPPIGDALQGK